MRKVGESKDVVEWHAIHMNRLSRSNGGYNSNEPDAITFFAILILKVVYGEKDD